MNNRLTQAQLSQIVAEVERLSQRRDDELEPEQVKQILQELSLPPELFDEALVQLRRREALAVQQRRNRWIVGGVIAAVVVAIAGTTVIIQQNQQALQTVSTVQSQITLTKDGSSILTEVNRQTSPLIYYRVTLKDAPIGKRLSLSCDWMNPRGEVVHQNRWQTKAIDKQVWHTYCRHQFNLAAAPGTWTVQMSLGDRLISTTSFIVK
ncbi:MAG: DUF3859 domain-containing protein [Coleofasciculus sp. C1-SOL-03]|jgi:hypothetical protein|uniref:DUF3859 domain-containing protein n=1 Tax=Coleofasciculus sp. C1-SOL-03 TaxID=3069522 RepID=UPI0032F666F1